MTYFRWLIAFLLFFYLTACHAELSYDYLMQHPDRLKKEAEKCEIDEKNDVKRPSCAVVMDAANDFTVLLKAQQKDPEQFGQYIMDAETAYVKAKEERLTSQQSLEALQTKRASKEEITDAKEKLKRAKVWQQETKRRMNILLAVVGVTSPE